MSWLTIILAILMGGVGGILLMCFLFMAREPSPSDSVRSLPFPDLSDSGEDVPLLSNQIFKALR